MKKSGIDWALPLWILVFWLLLAAAWVLPAACHGQDTNLKPGKLLVVDNIKGRWWPMETAVYLTLEHKELKLSRTLVQQLEADLKKLKQQLANKDERILVWQTAHGIELARAEIAVKAVEEAIKSKVRTEEDAKAWWRHPALWFSVGVVVTGAAATGVGYAVTH